jgi:hypothetical protein
MVKRREPDAESALTGAVAVPDTLSRVRWVGRLVGWYLLVALGSRIAETAGLRRCGCAAEWWCKRAKFSGGRIATSRSVEH